MHLSNHYAHRKELVLVDRTNLRSLVNLLPEPFARQIENLWASEEGLLGLNEISLLKELKRRDKAPSALEYKIRVKFWLEFDRVQTECPKPEPMRMENITGNDFPKESFYRFYLTDPLRLAFLLSPVGEYAAMLDFVLTQSLGKLAIFIETLEPGNDPDRDYINLGRLIRIHEMLSGKGKPTRMRRTTEDDTPPEEHSPTTPLVPAPETPEERAARIAELEAVTSNLPGQTT